MHTGILFTNYKILIMLHLNDRWEEKRLPKFKAVVKMVTSKGSYKMTIRATYFDLCMMTQHQDWVITWFHQKAAKVQLNTFIRIYAEGVQSVEIIVAGEAAEDVNFGLEDVAARVVWTNDRPFMCGDITMFNLKRFMMASIYYTSAYASNDIRHLIRDAVVRSIVEAYKFGSEDTMTWAFGSGTVRDSLIRLRKYFRPIK